MIVALLCADACDVRRRGRNPAEARVVVEPDPHPLRCERCRRGESGKDGQGDDEADGTSHEWSPRKAAEGKGVKLSGTLAAAL